MTNYRIDYEVRGAHAVSKHRDVKHRSQSGVLLGQDRSHEGKVPPL